MRHVTRTDAKGEFEIPNAVVGIVTVTASGYATAKRSWPPRQGRELQFALTAPPLITGSLVDAATRRGVESLPGADVLASLAGGYVMTDTEGTFKVLGLVPER